MKSIKENKRSSINVKGNVKSDILNKYAVIILAVFTFMLYVQAMYFGFTGFDDTVIVLDNLELLGSFSNLKEVFLNDAFFQNGSQHFFRPLQNLSLLLDTVIAGGDLWMYHFSNVIFHTIAVVLLYFLLIELQFRSKFSFYTALLFASAPIFNHAIAWVPGRGDILLGLFSILFLLYLIKYFNSKKIKYLLYNFIAFVFAVLSKESALLLPLFAVLLVIVYDYKIILTKKSIIPAVFYTVIVVAYFLLRNSVITNPIPPKNFGIDILIANFRVLPEMIGKFFIPYNLSTLPNYSTINILTGLIVVALIIFATFRIKSKHNIFLAIYSIIWYLLFSVPGMLYKHDFGSFAYDYLEHRAYVPIIGLIILLNIIIKNVNFSDRNITVIIVGFIALFSFYTIKNSRNYENDLALYERSILTNPQTAALAYLNRGLIKAKSGNQKLAIDDFSIAADIFPEYPDAYSNRALARSEMGTKFGILDDYNKAIELNPKNPIFYFNRGVFKSANDDKNGSIADYLKAIELNPKYNNAYRNITYELNQKSDFEKSIIFATKGIENIPNFNELYLNRGVAKFQLNDKEGACADWQIASRNGLASATDLIKKYCQ